MLKVSNHEMVIDGIDVVAHSTTHIMKINLYRQLWWVFVWTDKAIDRFEDDHTLVDRLPTCSGSSLVPLWASEAEPTIEDTTVFVTLFKEPQEEFFGLNRAE